MKRLLCTLALFAALTLAAAGCLAGSGEGVLQDILLEAYQGFLAAPSTQQIPVYALETDELCETIYSGPQSGKMLRNSATIQTVPKQRDVWNAYEAGEKAVCYLNELYVMSDVFQTQGNALPVELDVMEGLYRDTGNSLTISGLDSAYLHGDLAPEDGMERRWELLPFVVIAPDGGWFERAVYLYFRISVLQEDCDILHQCIIADQSTVCGLLEHLLNLNDGIEQEDRTSMLLFIEYNSLLDASQRIIASIREGFQNFIDPESSTELKLDGAGNQEKIYIMPARSSDAAFNGIARSSFVSLEEFEEDTLDASIDALLDMTHRTLEVSYGLMNTDLGGRAMEDFYCSIALIFGMNLVDFNEWGLTGRDDEAGFRWEVLPFSMQIPVEQEPGFILSRPNLYVRMLTVQEDGSVLCEEWIIEDRTFISGLLPGCLAEIEEAVGDLMNSWETAEEAGAA